MLLFKNLYLYTMLKCICSCFIVTENDDKTRAVLAAAMRVNDDNFNPTDEHKRPSAWPAVRYRRALAKEDYNRYILGDEYDEDVYEKRGKMLEQVSDGVDIVYVLYVCYILYTLYVYELS